MKLEESGSLSSDYTIRLPHQNSMPLTQKCTYCSMEQIQSLEINPFIYDQLTTTKEARLYSGEKTVSSKYGAGKTGQLHVKKKKNEIRTFSAATKSLQSCLTLCDPIDSSPPGFPVPGILQARTLEWVAISFSNMWKWKVKVKSLIRVSLVTARWTATYQAPPSTGFSRQEYWSGVPLPSPRTFSKCLKFSKNWKCIKDLNVKLDTIKFLEENKHRQDTRLHYW